MDCFDKFQPLFWTSYNVKQVSLFFYERKFMFFTDAYSMFYVIKYGSLFIMGCYMLLNILTNRLTLFDILTNATATTTKRSKIYLQNTQPS